MLETTRAPGSEDEGWSGGETWDGEDWGGEADDVWGNDEDGMGVEREALSGSGGLSLWEAAIVAGGWPEDESPQAL